MYKNLGWVYKYLYKEKLGGLMSSHNWNNELIVGCHLFKNCTQVVTSI